jgi:hypothetical protein
MTKSNVLIYMICLLTLRFNVVIAAEQNIEPSVTWVQLANIPAFAKEVFSEKKLNEKYDFSFHINPFYLRGDFNGDRRSDLAILIKEKKTGKVGIAIFHDGRRDVFIVGAGNAIGNGGDDFKWMNVWSVHQKGKVQSPEEEKSLQLIGEALSVEKGDSASGLIYWDGKKYKWYQMTD